MKQFLTIFCMFCLLTTHAQDKEKKETLKEREKRYNDEANPFKEFGYKPRIITLSKGKYKEFFTDTIVQIGSFTYNRLSKRITGIHIIENKGISEATARPDLVSRWMTPDPLSDEFPEWSPYNFVNDNPVRYIDPEGLAPVDIIGVTRSDANKFKQDIHTVLGDSKFDNVRSLITTSGKEFDKIDSGDLSAALDGVSLSADEQTFVDAVVNTINSDKVHKVEFISGDFTSSEGATAVKNHFNNNISAGSGDAILTPEGKLSSSIIKNLGDGFNVATGNGSHSFLTVTSAGNNRAVTSSHEVLGHGIPSAKGSSAAQNNANAIRTDNLVRRILGLPQRNGSKHGGFKQGHITQPQKLPITN